MWGMHVKSETICGQIRRWGFAGPASVEELYCGVRFNPGEREYPPT